MRLRLEANRVSFFLSTTENVTSSSTAISLLPAAYSPHLASAGRPLPTPLISSSVYLLLRTSIYSVGKSTSLPSKETVKSSVFSKRKVDSAAMTLSVSCHGVTGNKIPHISALLTTSTEHSVNTDSVPVVTSTWETVCDNSATESSLVSRNSLQTLPSRLTTSSELIDLERPETTRVTISLKFHYTQSQSLHQTSLFSQMSPSNPAGAEISRMTNSTTRLQRTLGLIISTSISQHNSSPTGPGGQISAPADQRPTETDKITFSSLRFYRSSGSLTQTSLSQPSSPLNASSSQPDVSTLTSTSTILLPCTTHEVIMTKSTETKEEMNPTVYQRQTFLGVSSFQTMASTLMSTSSVALRCPTNEEVTALPTYCST